MASELFDPLLDLALDVAKRGRKAKPPIAPPKRLVPMLKFAKLPDKAKDTVLDVLDSDPDFRQRVAEAADEKTVGRVGIALVERPAGWREFVDQMVGAAEEPLVEFSSDARKIAKQLDVAQRARDRVEAERDESIERAQAASRAHDLASAERDDALAQLDELRSTNADLAEQRQRAVAELKRTEEIMARHIAERKRLETVIEQMTAAQLTSTAVGGGVTDVEVRAAVDGVEASIRDMQRELDGLRRAATPERIVTERRTPLPVPHGLFDDSVEFAEYLLSVPNMTVLVDGYNVTREAHDSWDLEQQRSWLEQGLATLSSRYGATFDVVFDGADLPNVTQGRNVTGVRVRFSPDGVEADDVVIHAVSSVEATRPVVVVSSDNRVRAGAGDRGANVLHSRQLIALL